MGRVRHRGSGPLPLREGGAHPAEPSVSDPGADRAVPAAGRMSRVDASGDAASGSAVDRPRNDREWRLAGGSAAVIVVGDVKMGAGAKIEVVNSALLIWEEAQRVGFGIDTLINDIYALNNRSMLVFNSLKWDYSVADHAAKSSVLIDRCLVLTKGTVHWRDRPIMWQAGQLELDL